MSQSVNEQIAAGKTLDHCSAVGCARPEIACVGRRPVCLTHFQLICYTRLEELSQNILTWSGSGSTRESAFDFIEECSRQATSLSRAEAQLNGEDQMRLLAIAFWAAELGRQAHQHTYPSPEN